MINLRNQLDKIKPHFEENGKLHSFRSVFDGLETFLFVPNTTAKTGTNIHDSIDSKRIMSLVVISVLPALLFGMYNIGYQNYTTAGQLATATHFDMFVFGLLALLPKLIVSYVVGLSIEFAWAQWKHEEIQEGYLVTGILIPLIIPITTPLWILVIAIAFAVIIGKEIFGGTGMNICNVALLARAFLFFAYPSKMTGDTIWVANQSIFGFGNDLPDAATMATPLGQIAIKAEVPYSISDMIIGLIPGSVGETSVIAIALGAIILLWSGIASWKIMFSVFASGAATAYLFNTLGMTSIPWYEHIILGGFCFGAVFMATDPVTAARTETGKYIYGALIGVMALIVRVMNPGYPEGMMLAILFANMLAPLVDSIVVQKNINKRMKRLTTNK